MRRRNIRKKLFVAEGTAIAILLIILLLVLLHRPGSEDAGNTEAGRAYISAEEAKDPAQALARIQEAREAAESMAAQAEQESSEAEEMAGREDLEEQISTMNIRELSPEEIAALQQRFDTTVVVGDSMAQAVFEYEFLDENHVKYQRSTSIGQLYDRTEEALAMLPDRIVFFTGLYDVDVFENPEDYYNAYLERINQVWARDPDIQIYISSLLPPSDGVAEWREDLARSPLYDEQLKRLCSDTGAHYIDTNWIVLQELYLEDGIHFNYLFYTIWIQYVALVAGI